MKSLKNLTPADHGFLAVTIEDNAGLSDDNLADRLVDTIFAEDMDTDDNYSTAYDFITLYFADKK